MAVSPQISPQTVVSLAILSNGQALADTVQIVSVSIMRAANRVPSAQLVVLDGDPATRAWPLADASTFEPGAAIVIKAGYAGTQALGTLFEGVVVNLGVEVSAGQPAQLVIECRDRAVSMTVGPKNANHVDLSDDAIMTKLAAAHGLTLSVDPTTPSHDVLVQYYCTDWDFLLARAAANGRLVIATDGALCVTDPAVAGEAALELTWGDDLFDFQAEVDARGQFAEVRAVAWDPSSQALATAEAGPTVLNAQGNLSSTVLSGVIGLESFTLQTAARLRPEALNDWARARQVRAGLSRVRGRMTFQGDALAKVGCLISVTGVGARFDGLVFVTAVTHRIRAGAWLTDVEFGLSDGSGRDRPVDPTSSPDSWLAGAEGLQIGIVARLDGDPAGEQRIQVQLPVLGAASPGVWARFAQSYASQGFGSFTLPEIGDEVVIGCLNGDPSNPVILGSLYSRRRPPPYALTAENEVKALVTRSQTRIEIDDAAKTVRLRTPGGNSALLNDQDQSIRFEDQNGSSVTLGPGGIVLKSAKDITLTATGSINLAASDAISLEATGDLTAKGMNVTADAQVAFTGKGASSAEVSAGGVTTLKGAMVMIN